ncbi:zinc C2H2 type family protein, putative [Ichthyophthirius multifiliis]|uniref:Zinc C2H2 type family protein, putative n=1 Tax=Ichthyophthirius multifiliis TaxID=5932 RepID=G0QXD9_ICHMU|nr:zinc C2H2 type family protein, putative [Ichthyophthirius multifiliis]EGR30119.1 zinc C2H2 type family protein, putative [Ichthyophthirius multifiliis]|eukprot:XP_004031355.1 zinc C2H2 type family protein, putative [Ichthyophthirius multifiliis]
MNCITQTSEIDIQQQQKQQQLQRQQQGFSSNIIISQPQTSQKSQYDEQLNYYQQEACRLYIANIVLTNQVKELIQDKNELLQKYQKLEKRQLDTQLSLAEERKKRNRRTAHEIERHYKCPQQQCQKSYGSEGSLAQHIKLKHPEFYQSISMNVSQNISSGQNIKQQNGQNYQSSECSDSYIEENQSSTSSKQNNEKNMINDNNSDISIDQNENKIQD